MIPNGMFRYGHGKNNITIWPKPWNHNVEIYEVHVWVYGVIDDDP